MNSADQELQRRRETLFPAIRERLRASKPIFEIGLVLGGTVSTGAYTAGALDFLLEALEAWHADPATPHEISLPFAAGSSGGAVSAAILSVLTRRPVEHVTGDARELVRDTTRRNNPLWNLWVQDYDIADLLTSGDLPRGAKIASLLDSSLLDRMQAGLVQFAQTEASFERRYFPAPFRLAVTLSNLRGIPYRLDVPALHGFRGAVFLQHDDCARFAIPNGAPDAEKREDEFWLDPGAADGGRAGYETLALYATASGAGPGLLAARDLVQPFEHYLYRPLVVPSPEPPGYCIRWPVPDWGDIERRETPGYRFTSIDGGLFNDDPVQLAHQALAGLVGRNPQHPANAFRAILMIDPLADKPEPLQASRSDLRWVASHFLSAAVTGARYRTADMTLFGDGDVFSRFQLIPSRTQPRRLGREALAGSWFNALSGFCSRAFRVHDFLLGRNNMQNYIRRTLLLRGDNLLFRAWSSELRERFAVRGDGDRVAIGRAHAGYFLPILPDLTDATAPLELPVDGSVPWPAGQIDLAGLRPRFRRRFADLLAAARRETWPGAVGAVAGAALVPLAASALSGATMRMLREDLVRAALLERKAGR